MARGDAAVRDALCIEGNHLEQLAVALEFLLIIFRRVEQHFDKRLTMPSLVACYGRIPNY